MFGLARRTPNVGLSVLNDSLIDRFFDDFFEDLPLANRSPVSLPTVDIYSDDNKTMNIRLEVPGYDRDDIQMAVNNGVLEVRGERTEKEEQADKKRSYVIRESSSGFSRRIVLPEGADADKIAAELDNGVLTVTIPVERSEAKRIEIATPKNGHRKKLASSVEATQEVK